MATTDGREGELKTQGLVEASQDPDSNVTSQDVEKKILEESKKAGVPAFHFNPDASAEDKRAQLREATANIRPHREHKAATLVSDVDDGQPSAYSNDLPPPSKAGAISPVEVAKQDNAANGDSIGPGGFDYSRVGWAPRFGLPVPEGVDMDTLMTDQSTWLEERLQDKFFGDWYHNTAVIFFCAFSSYTVAILGGGLGWLFIILAVCATYYRTSIRRVRRRHRDDINRAMQKARLETDTESLEWMNSFLVKFWPIIQPMIGETIITTVDHVLSENKPPFLEDLKLRDFTLGTKPPRMEHVKTYPKTEEDVVLQDWKFSFTPNDTADMTARQLKVKINPKIVLEVRIGKGMVSKGLDVIVQDMECTGIMRVKIKLQLGYPFVDRVEVCFLERPHFDYVCKPLGGDTFGFDINFIPGLESFIQEQIHATLGPMMYNPHVFPIEVAKMLAGSPVDQAIGVLQIHFHGAQGLRNPDPLAGTPDPYATVQISGRQELARTKTISGNANPRWNETVNVVISSLKDDLNLKVFDYNEFRKDKELGEAIFPLDKFETESEYENEALPLMVSGRARGQIQVDLRFFPVLEGTKTADGKQEPPPESLTGICKFTVEQAKELDASKSTIGQLNPYAVLLLNGKEVHISKKLKRTNNPIWSDASKEMLITNRKTAKLGLVIKDDRELATDPVIGTYQIKLDDLLDLTSKGSDWFRLAGVKTGRVKLSVQWRPVALRGAIAGSGYVDPIGVMRLYFKNARDLRNVETVGKSDPYARVLLSGVPKGRTVTWKNNLNPDWDEVIYVPVHSEREKLTVEVMDEENVGKDRSLGQFDIPLTEYISKDADGMYEVNHTNENIAQPLLSGTGRFVKGTVNFTCSFFPTIPTINPEEEEAEQKEQSSINGDVAPLTPSKASFESARKSIENTPGKISGLSVRDRSDTSATVASENTTNSKAPSDLAKKLTDGEAEQSETASVKQVVPKLRLTEENLLEYESGLLIFKLISAELSRTNVHLEVLMDDYVFPAYSSHKVKTKHYEFNEVGDAIVRELDQSRITLRLIEDVDKEGKGDTQVIAKLTGPTISTLQRCLYKPTQLTLRDNHGQESKVTVSLRYLPIKMQLDPSESFNNMGKLRVDVMDAADLPAADRNGYSDPFCKFYLNGKDVYKTDKQKKTLHPAWNETFEVQIRSRTSAKFECHVFDWDFGDKADFLGKTTVPLDILEPFKQQEVSLGLDGKSGTVRLRLLFTPDFVQRTRQGSSTFHGTFAAPGKVVGAPVKGVGKGVMAIGGGVVKTGSFIGKTFRRKSYHEKELPNVSRSGTATPNGELNDTPVISVESPDATASPSTPVSGHKRDRSMGASSVHSLAGGAPSAETGTASLSILSASGFPSSAKVRVEIKQERPGGSSKEVHKTKAVKAEDGSVSWGEGESFKVQCAADTPFHIEVVDHSTFGRDEELGKATFFISDQGSGSEQTITVGEGKVVIRSSFQAADAQSTANSPRNTLRKSMFGTKRDTRDQRERSTTPA
ncbi:uncharacterized protein PV09_00189 [Verruconis gallopava]|uniref:Tricalbin n=1 Tax=Verruconis gallopava TaxID=253628 RepID=A0A0D1Z8D7_9PEZI|nr:uncharacterized protein PV09_00189 [Verruconis gallopava]KIW09267.1 hypothetical protein PV09_00189 [Verruconis gallopava]